jgi:hypothetical protein
MENIFKIPEQEKFVVIPMDRTETGEPSNLTNGLAFQYLPEFMNLQANYLNDVSQRNRTQNTYGARVMLPLPVEGFSGSYGMQGYDIRQSNGGRSQSYRGTVPTYGLNYTNGGFNASVDVNGNQSPYFNLNYFKRF